MSWQLYTSVLGTSTLTHNSKHELTNIQDPLLRNVGFAYDLAGRITTQTLPDTRTIGYSYDPNGNIMKKIGSGLAI